MSERYESFQRQNGERAKRGEDSNSEDPDGNWWIIPGIIDEAGYRQLEVWKKGMVIVDAVYGIGEQMPRHEQYGLTAQMQEASASVPANLAEGYTSGTDGMYLRHVRIACGSAAELETHLLIARRRAFVMPSQVDPVLKQLVQLRKSLYGLRNYLRKELQ